MAQLTYGNVAVSLHDGNSATDIYYFGLNII